MAIDNSGFMNEIREIASGGQRVLYEFTADLFYDTTVIQVFRISSVNRYANFMTDYAETFVIDLLLQQSDYDQLIRDNADKLKINLIIKRWIPGSRPDITRLTMRAFLKANTDRRAEQNTTADMDYQSSGKLQMNLYQFNLVDLAIEQMRVMGTGGNYPVTSPASVLRTLLGGAGASLDLPLEQKPKAPEMVPADSEVVKNMVTIKHGTGLCDLPGYLQQHYGIYNTGMGHFYHDQTWYVWPMYNTKRFELAKRTLTLINVPRDRFPSIEKTHAVRGNSVVILLTGQTKFEDTSNRQQFNVGNGTRATRASAISGDEGRIVDKGRVFLQRSSTNTEIRTNARGSGVDFIPDSNEVTDNTPRVLSRTATVNGASAQFTWESSDPALLQPGMPVKYLYMDGNSVSQRYGVLTAMESAFHLAQKGLMESNMLCNTALTVFLDNANSTFNNSL